MAGNVENTYRDIELKKDCKFYKDMGHGKCMCSALKELYCRNEKCKFYKHGKIVIEE